LKSQTFFFFFS